MTTIATGLAPADLAAVITAGLASLPGRPLSPILGAAVIEIDPSENVIEVATYDYDRSTIATLTLGVDIEISARLAVSGRLLGAVAKVLPKRATIDLELTDTLRVKAGATVFTLPLMDVDDFPSMPAMPEVGVGRTTGETLTDVVGRVAKVTEKQSDAENVAQHIELRGEADGIRVTAVDRHTIARSRIDWEHGADFDARLVAGDLLAILRPLATADSIEIHADHNLVMLTGQAADNLTIAASASLVDAQMPDLTRLLLIETDRTITLDEQFAEALGRSVKMVDKVGVLRMVGAGVDDSSGTTSIDLMLDDGALLDRVEHQAAEGDPIQWACNPKMLRTALDIVGLPAAAHWTGDPLKPVTLFSDDGDTQVVFMGVRVVWS